MQYKERNQEETRSRVIHTMYRPSLKFTRATRLHSYARLALVSAASPDHPCGQARRTGYLGPAAEDLAVYRLKIHWPPLALPPCGYVTHPG
jgi:hypothetical protein